MLPHFLFHSETLRLQGLKCKARDSKCKARNARLEIQGSRLEIQGSKARGSKYKARRLEARNTRLEGSRLEGSRLEGSTYRILDSGGRSNSISIQRFDQILKYSKVERCITRYFKRRKQCPESRSQLTLVFSVKWDVFRDYLFHF